MAWKYLHLVNTNDGSEGLNKFRSDHGYLTLGCIAPPSPYVFLPFTPKIFGQPIPENSSLFPTFCYGCTYEKKNYPLSDHF